MAIVQMGGSKQKKDGSAFFIWLSFESPVNLARSMVQRLNLR